MTSDARPGKEIFLSYSQSKRLSDICLSIPLFLSRSIVLVLTHPHAQIDAARIAQLGVYKNHNS